MPLVIIVFLFFAWPYFEIAKLPSNSSFGACKIKIRAIEFDPRELDKIGIS